MKKITELLDKNDCVGCAGCSNACPFGCITMIESLDGFYHPSINDEKCTNCGQCSSVCPQLNKYENEFVTSKIAYAAVNKNDATRKNSSSGGIFNLLAKSILKENGIVFGATIDRNAIVRHICIDNEKDIIKLQKSKYVQSFMGDSFKRVKEYLRAGKLVYFSGTPCQIAGLKNYLVEDYDNLICQDIICHGVPSPLMWEYYCKYISELYKEPIQSVDFRNKNYGWRKFGINISFPSKNYKSQKETDYYMKSFLNNNTLNGCCYKCNYKGDNIVSDVTLGDFWGVEDFCPELDDDLGTSLVIINSRKGEKLFNQIKKDITYKKVNFEDVIKDNPAYHYSVEMPKEREYLFLNIKSYDDFKNIVAKQSLKNRIRNVVFLLQIRLHKIIYKNY